MTLTDFVMVANGAIAAMYFTPGGTSGWRRHVRLVLDGIRTTTPQ